MSSVIKLFKSTGIIFCAAIMLIFIAAAALPVVSGYASVFKASGKPKIYETDILLEADPYNIYDVEHEVIEYACRYSKCKGLFLGRARYFMSEQNNSYAEFLFSSDISIGIEAAVRIEITGDKNTVSEIRCIKDKTPGAGSSYGKIPYVNISEVYNNAVTDDRYSEFFDKDPVCISIYNDNIYIENTEYIDKTVTENEV